MEQLNEQKRDDLKALLEDHQKVVDALFNLDKSQFVVTLTVSDQKNNDFTEVELHKSVAKKALAEHKNWVNTELKKLGVEIKSSV